MPLARRTWAWTRRRSTAAHEAADFVWSGRPVHLLERSPFELSGGQKRRAAMAAGVMAMRPRILVLDEPAAGLDPEGRDDTSRK